MTRGKVEITDITRVCSVVRDVQRSREEYERLLGLASWEAREFEARFRPGLPGDGAGESVRLRRADCPAGLLTVRLVEPLAGSAAFARWLNRRGEGLHHFTAFLPDVGEGERYLNRLGFPTVLSGRDGEHPFAWFDLPPLRAVVELSSAPPVRPEAAGSAGGGLLGPFPGVKQIGICVRDAVRTAENYWSILGIGPWEVRHWGSHALFDRTVNGRPAWAWERLAHAYLGDLELELVQPVEGVSIYADWLEHHEEGLHHLKFLCGDIDATSRRFAEAGFPSMQSGHFGDPRLKAGGFDYFEVPPLNCILEPVHKPVSLPAEPFARVPAERRGG